MYPELFLVSAIVFGFFDQTSIRFNLIYFLIVVGALGLTAVKRLSGIKFKIPKEIMIFWLLLMAQAVLSLINTSSIPVSKIGLFIMLSALVYFGFGAAFGKLGRRIPLILFISSIIFSVVSLGVIFKVIPLPANQSSLFSWTFGHNRIAGLLILLLPAAIVYVAGLISRWQILAFLSLAIPFLTLLFSGGRAAILGFLAALVYLNYFGPLNLRRWLRLAAIACLIPILVLMIFPIVGRLWPNSGLIRTINSDSMTHGVLIKPLSNDGRLDYWNGALRAMADRPLGWGMETSRLILPKFRLEDEQSSSFVHNQYLQAGVELGVVGAVIYILLILLVLYQAHRAAAAGQTAGAAGIFAGILASAIAAFFDYDWQYPSIYLLWWFLAGTLMMKIDQVPDTALEMSQKNHRPIVIAVLSFLILGYGVTTVTVKYALIAVGKSWNSWGKSMYPVIAPAGYNLHPELAENVLAIGLRRLPVDQIPEHINSNILFFRRDNRMLEKVLRWQESFGSPDDIEATALQMLENDPQNGNAQSALEKLDKKE